MRARGRARRNTNIALVKYWGKRDAALNLPAVGCLSLTLDGLATRTERRLRRQRSSADALHAQRRAGRRARCRAHRRSSTSCARAPASRERAAVESSNSFPTAAGLASSASAFAALALAATRAAGLDARPRELSMLARRGSGSAARSIFGGFVEMHRGERADGEDAFAEPIAHRLGRAPGDRRRPRKGRRRRSRPTACAHRRDLAVLRRVGGDVGAATSPTRARRDRARAISQALGEVTERSACDARLGDGGAAGGPLLHRRDHRRLSRGPGAAQERRAGVVHQRRRPARQGAHRRGQRATRSSRRWRGPGVQTCDLRARASARR